MTMAYLFRQCLTPSMRDKHSKYARDLTNWEKTSQI